MNNERQLNTSPSADRTDRMQQVVAEYVRAVTGGDDVSPDAWADSHPDLMPELAAELKKAQLIGAACRKALAGASPIEGVDSFEQPSLSSSGANASLLHVRCPHCHNSVDIVGDASLIDIVCSSCGSSFSLLCDTYATPAVKNIGRFELIERLGMGGFGTVWKARDTQLDRTVAIKIPREGRLGTPELEQSFIREARAAAQLKHPGIVSVHEVGRQEDTIYIVSDLVRGASLSEWLSATQPTAREAAELCAKLADALHHAHQAGVVHRDLKPSNIMIDLDGAPHIMDFGLARRDAGEVTVTVDGQMLGTPAYMSPEQARGEAHLADRKSDVYCLGVIFFQLLTGELPFRGHARMLLVQILRDEPPKPRTIKAGISRDLQTICLKCLEKEPARRYTTAADLADDLRRFLHGEPIVARPVSRIERTWRWCKRKPVVASLIATSIAASLVSIVAVTMINLWIAERRAKEEAVARLYDSLVNESRALRLAGQPGYRTRSWKKLKEARWLNTSGLDLDVLRQEAIDCLGDFRGNEPVTIALADRLITVCSLHPNGKLLAIGHQDGRIELRDPASGSTVSMIEGKGTIKALSFAGVGDRLVFVDDSRRVCECTIETAITGKEAPKAIELFRVDDYLEEFEFILHGRYLVAYSKTIATVWDTEKRGRIFHVTAPENRVLGSVSLSPDAKWLAASSTAATDNMSVGPGSDRLMMWDVATGELMEKDVPINLGRGYKKSLAFSHDSKLVAYGGDGLALFRAPSFDPYLYYPGDSITAVAFSSDSQLLALVQSQGTVTLRSVATNEKIASLPHPRGGDDSTKDESVTFSADGGFLVSGKMSSARVWNLRSGEERIVLSGHEAGVPTLAFSPNGTVLASGSKDHTVGLWNVAEGTLARPPLQLNGPAQCLAFSPNGRWLATADWSAGGASTATLHISSAADISIKSAVAHTLGNVVHGVAFSPNGKYLAACGLGMHLWSVDDNDVENGTPRLTEVTLLTGVDSLFVKFSPDSQLVVWAEKSDEVRVWDIAAAKGIAVNARKRYGWHGLAFVADGSLAFVGPDGAVEVWDIRGNKKLFSLGNPGEFQSPHIATSPDGTYLAALESPETVALWDIRAKRKLFHLRPERSEIWSLAFSPNGTKLAVGLSDGGVAIWDYSSLDRALKELDLAWFGNDVGPAAPSYSPFVRKNGGPDESSDVVMWTPRDGTKQRKVFWRQSALIPTLR